MCLPAASKSSEVKKNKKFTYKTETTRAETTLGAKRGRGRAQHTFDLKPTRQEN